LATLSKEIDVRSVIGVGGSRTALPAAPAHTRPSGKTIAAEAPPGMPESATCERNCRSSAAASCGVSCAVLGAGGRSPPPPPHPARTAATMNQPATMRLLAADRTRVETQSGAGPAGL
jgi:hypothetical protein